jgi:hypothetical protein
MIYLSGVPFVSQLYLPTFTHGYHPKIFPYAYWILNTMVKAEVNLRDSKNGGMPPAANPRLFVQSTLISF